MPKVILTHDVPKLGAAGDVVEVKPGYARNYLLPRKFAVRWTPAAQKQIDQMAAARVRREIATAEEARTVRDQLTGKVVNVSKRASESGRLFGSVSSREVAEAIKEQLNYTVDYRKITFDSVVRNVGKHQANINLHEDVSVQVTVLVDAAKRS